MRAMESDECGDSWHVPYLRLLSLDRSDDEPLASQLERELSIGRPTTDLLKG